MININKALEENKIKLSDLPKSVQERISGLSDVIKKYNEVCEEYDLPETQQNAETEEYLDNQEQYITGIRDELVDDINAFAKNKAKAEKEKAASGAVVKTAAQIEAEKAAAAKSAAEGKKEEKDDFSWVWWVVGIAAAAVGINIMKNKK